MTDNNMIERTIKIHPQDWDNYHLAAKIAFPDHSRPRQPWIRSVLNREAKKLLKEASAHKMIAKAKAYAMSTENQRQLKSDSE